MCESLARAFQGRPEAPRRVEAAAAVAVVGHGGGYGGGDGGGNGGDKGGSPPDEDPEDDLNAFARRKCRRCGKVEYLRKGGCANPSCVAWLVFSEFFSWKCKT